MRQTKLYLFIGWIVLSASPLSLQAQDRGELEKMTREVVTAELINPDFDKLKSYFHPDATFQWPGGWGEDVTVDNFIQWRKTQSENVKNEADIEAIRVDGNETIVFAVWKGTVLNDPETPHRVGKIATVPFVLRYNWNKGKITRMEMYWDGAKINRDLDGE